MWCRYIAVRTRGGDGSGQITPPPLGPAECFIMTQDTWRANMIKGLFGSAKYMGFCLSTLET
jgi:hypothetical protein